MPQTFAIHQDFTSGILIMSILSTGIEEILLDNGHIIGVVTSQSVNNPGYTNQTVVYTHISNSASSNGYPTFDQRYSVIENSNTQITPILPCSVSIQSTIVFTISSYITTYPAWISIESTSGIINITAPEVSADIEYKFYIISTFLPSSEAVKQIIILTVLN